MMSLIISNTIVTSVFTGAIATAYFICKIYNLPFYNSKTIIEDLDKLKQNVIPIYFGANYMVLLTNLHLDNRCHSFIGSVLNIGMYVLFIEFLYYTYHRIIHHPALYNMVHSFHHTKVLVYPIDALHFSVFDLSCYMACLHFPTYIMRLTMFEYIFVLFFYITMGFFAHSKLAFQHHILHHQFFKCNYCLVFPIFDMAFNTFMNINFMDTNKFDDFMVNDVDDLS